ncbi:lytic murein transglycosylase [Halomonadaceae bacterium KBTZ08]
MRTFPLMALLIAASIGPAVANSDFDHCVGKLRDHAREQGISESVTRQVLTGMKPLERVIELDRSQPEFTRSFRQYLERRVTEHRIEKGRRLYQKHAQLLQRITRQTGVPGRYLIAFWGLETNFGSYTGKMPIPRALATLACDRRRSDYFTRELVSALRIIERGDVTAKTMEGSWAGAMGQMQFMPSVYLDHAVDADGSGEIDLWNSVPDALTSAGHLLESLGWNEGERWGREVQLPEGFDYSLAQGLSGKRSLSRWRELGVRDAFGRALPHADMEAALLLPSGHTGPAFLVYDNFRVIMGWNQSEFYALAVGHLADRIVGAGPLQTRPPNHEPLKRETIKALQTALKEAGYEPGPADGILGSGTRGALRRFQKESGLRADGYPDPESLRAIGVD